MWHGSKHVHRTSKGRRAAARSAVNALRMRPDRIIVGEVRGAEALDMLQAMNTGHDGGLTTIHANTARDALHWLDTMVAMSNVNIPERAVRQQTASAINLVIQLTRLRTGRARSRALPKSPAWKVTSCRCRTSSCSTALACGVTGRCADDSERPASG